MTKPRARILDATAGNRLMWKTKDTPLIYFIDVEGGLEFPPDSTMNCTKTSFPDKRFNIIFFDPPHGWGKKLGGNIYTCRTTEEFIEYRKKHDLNRWGNKPSYYGLDKYQSKSELLSFIHKAQKEFFRILKDEGVLWVKWNEMRIPLRKVLPFFKNWNLFLKLPIRSSLQRFGKKRTYWLMFMKKTRERDVDR